MGWLWGSEDPFKDLDPSLRKFLEQQTPKRDENIRSKPPSGPSQLETSPQPSSTVSRPWSTFLGLSTNNTTVTSAQSHKQDEIKPATPVRPRVPEQSLYQDGRYADLWKTYRPFGELDDASKSDQERLLDIVHGFRDRRKELKRAAVENCASEQLAVHECFRTGGWASRMTMCRAENRALDRCITMQSQFLTALGYLDMLDRGEEESERMQMHADKLYQKMKAQEVATNEAREKGLPPPTFDEPLLGKSGDAAPWTVESGRPPTISYESLPKQTKEKYEAEVLKDLEGAQRELAKRDIEQELASRSQLYVRVTEQYRRGRLDQLDRRAAGDERIQDKVMRYLDFRDWSKVDAEWAEMRAQRKREEEQSK